MNLNLINRVPYHYSVTSLIDEHKYSLVHINERSSNKSALLIELDSAHDPRYVNNYHVRLVRQVDQDTAADSSYGGQSGYGSGHSGYDGHSGYGGHSSYSSKIGHEKSEYYCPEGVPAETAIFATLAAAGLSFGVLFMAITMITGMERRKREAPSYKYEDNNPLPVYSKMFSQILWEGMYVYS